MKVKTAAAFGNATVKHAEALAEKKLGARLKSLKPGASIEVTIPVKVTVRFKMSAGGKQRQKPVVCCRCRYHKYSDGVEIGWCNGKCC